MPQVTEIRNTDPNSEWELGGKGLTVNGKKVMTGQEWLDRFIREYHMRADWIAADPSMGDDAEHDVLSAAKLASGVKND